jgi:hypothetical protein
MFDQVLGWEVVGYLGISDDEKSGQQADGNDYRPGRTVSDPSRPRIHLAISEGLLAVHFSQVDDSAYSSYSGPYNMLSRYYDTIL